MSSKSSSSLTGYVTTKLFQYELMTAVYVMEPWEKTLFNAVILVLFSLSFATVYQYTPVMINKVAALAQ
ncbi:hypothetical protein BCR43DRAFT_484507 [Syncephalastrum racemosum]|uniref:Small subunit of serine palmitoyltransferase-like protein n=1 Tax=Syncephalastrum racemosum TaxID=13706 RepID=A0A1X2HKV1_SYNRA|nr:hypothetical protein BCR43DRAFT_484507 [Syncephalastrum racemosum]